MKILFVCTANIVRSYMAEAILKGKLRKAGRTDIAVASAGLIPMNGVEVDKTAEQIVAEMGYPLYGHRARLLTKEMMEEADWVFVMEHSQKEKIKDTYPEFASKIRLLKTCSREYDGKNGDIGDPYRLSPLKYRQCFSEIYMSIQGVLKCISNTGN
ncbi:MAG: hypothetical protein N2572_07105 [Syntrophales bacterium]|nr:hypothetical protein [Syntrophales bacterium]